MTVKGISNRKRKELEQRLKKLQGYYPGLLDDIGASDPTPNGEYVMWIAAQWSVGNIELPEDIRILKENLAYFHARKGNLPIEYRDIMVFEEPGDFYEFVDSLQPADDVMVSKSGYTIEIHPNAELIAEEMMDSGRWQVFRVTDPAAVAQMSEDTKWCVRHEDTAADYLSEAPFYFFVLDGELQMGVHYPRFEYQDTYNRKYF
jgi:hypothetical protein